MPHSFTGALGKHLAQRVGRWAVKLSLPARLARASRVSQIDIPDKTGTGDTGAGPTVGEERGTECHFLSCTCPKHTLLPPQDPAPRSSPHDKSGPPWELGRKGKKLFSIKLSNLRHSDLNSPAKFISCLVLKPSSLLTMSASSASLGHTPSGRARRQWAHQRKALVGLPVNMKGGGTQTSHKEKTLKMLQKAPSVPNVILRGRGIKL